MLTRLSFHPALRILSILILIAITIHPSTAVLAISPVFVAPDGSGSVCSQSIPCSLATGLSQVDAGGTLYAGAGTYTGIDDQVISLSQSTIFLGGWNGAATGTPVRDPAAYPSILDGENLRRVITIPGGSTASVVVDGWTIRNGNATGKTSGCSASNAAGCGGGILALSGSITIEHCIIENNVAATSTGDPARTGYGGGIYLQNPASATIRFNVIRSNDSSTAATGPVGNNGQGAGIYASGMVSEADLTISDNEFYGNDAAATAMMGYGAGVAIKNSLGVIDRNYFHDNGLNLSTHGSGLMAEHSDLAITSNRFTDNQGGEILYLVDSNDTLDSNLILNPAGSYGLFITLNSPGRMTVLSNNVIAQHQVANLAVNGTSGMTATVNLYQDTLDDSLYGLFLMNYTNVTISNSIISNHGISGIYENGSFPTVNVNYTLFHGNTDNGTWDVLVHPVPSGDPIYEDAESGNYHIGPDSAARDVAASAGYDVDFEGDDRPMGSGGTPYDAGADEFWWKCYTPYIVKP